MHLHSASYDDNTVLQRVRVLPDFAAENSCVHNETMRPATEKIMTYLLTL